MTAKCIRLKGKRKNNFGFRVNVLSIILFRSYKCVHCVHFFEASVLISASFMQHSCQHLITQHTPTSLMTHTHRIPNNTLLIKWTFPYASQGHYSKHCGHTLFQYYHRHAFIHSTHTHLHTNTDM